MKAPFRVICIKIHPDWVAAKIAGKANHPEVLDECLVLAVRPHSYFGHPMYLLAAFNKATYHPENFAILPDTTEEVEAEHQQEALIYQR